MSLSLLGRADLLRALALQGQPAARDEARAGLLGFGLRAPVVSAAPASADLGAQATTAATSQAQPPASIPGRLPPLRAALWAVTERIDPPTDDADTPPDVDPAPALPLATGPIRPGNVAAAPALMRTAQWWPALRQSLTATRPAGLDLVQISRRMASGQPLGRLPRASRRIWPGQLWLWADVGPAMAPHRADFQALLRQLWRLRGDAGLVLQAVQGWPLQTLGPPVLARQQPAGQRHRNRLPAGTQPPPGSWVLLYTDAGATEPDDRIAQAWQVHARQLLQRGCRPVHWGPMAPRQIGRAWAQVLPSHGLSGTRALRPQRGHWADEDQRQSERQRLQRLRDDLLHPLVACCVHLDLPLLRALRLLHPDLRREPALEALYWQDEPQVGHSAASRPLTPKVAARARRRLHQMPVPVQQAVLHTLLDHHAAHRRSTLAVECSLWASHASAEARASLPDAAAQQVQAAQAWLQQLSRLANEAEAQPAIAAFAEDLLARQGDDRVWLAGLSPVLARLWAATGQDEAPAGLAALDLVAVRSEQGAAPQHAYQLVLHGRQLKLLPEAGTPPPVRGAARLAGKLIGSHAALRIGQAEGEARVLPLRGEPVSLATLTAAVAKPIELVVGRTRLSLGRIERPVWADEFGIDAAGSYVIAPPLGHIRQRFELPDVVRSSEVLAPMLMHGVREVRKVVHQTDDDRFWRIGVDHQFGLFADLVIGEPLQRFRYIPPGEFWMGSPDEERAQLRSKDHQRWAQREAPRHRVRLTGGFWLADTACTQALWLAVMGGQNPSGFQDNPDNPVERVSWDDVQQFLHKLQPLLPEGCVAVLPTEAEWEYACRAGTETAYSFGPRITTAEVNFSGNEENEDAEPTLGQSRDQTVSVKTLLPNAWGLYEMHGNVWEWCADGAYRDYADVKPGEVVENPIQPPKQGTESPRVIRGGGWANDARNARSAGRNASPRGNRGDNLGFRLALRSSSSSPEPGYSSPEATQGIAPGPQGPVPAARRDAGPRRTEPGEAKGLKQWFDKLFTGNRSKQPKDRK